MSYVAPQKFHVKVRVYNEEIAFGKGVAQILALVQRHGSLAAAYKEMGMSSSKAWKYYTGPRQIWAIPYSKASAVARTAGARCSHPRVKSS